MQALSLSGPGNPMRSAELFTMLSQDSPWDSKSDVFPQLFWPLEHSTSLQSSAFNLISHQAPCCTLGVLLAFSTLAFHSLAITEFQKSRLILQNSAKWALQCRQGLLPCPPCLAVKCMCIPPDCELCVCVGGSVLTGFEPSFPDTGPLSVSASHTEAVTLYFNTLQQSPELFKKPLI